METINTEYFITNVALDDDFDYGQFLTDIDVMKAIHQKEFNEPIDEERIRELDIKEYIRNYLDNMQNCWILTQLPPIWIRSGDSA